MRTSNQSKNYQNFPRGKIKVFVLFFGKYFFYSTSSSQSSSFFTNLHQKVKDRLSANFLLCQNKISACVEFETGHAHAVAGKK